MYNFIKVYSFFISRSTLVFNHSISCEHSNSLGFICLKYPALVRGPHHGHRAVHVHVKVRSRWARPQLGSLLVRYILARSQVPSEQKLVGLRRIGPRLFKHERFKL